MVATGGFCGQDLDGGHPREEGMRGGGKGFDVGACQLVANEVGPSSQKDVLVRVFSGQLHCRAIKRCPCRKLSWRHWKKNTRLGIEMHFKYFGFERILNRPSLSSKFSML